MLGMRRGHSQEAHDKRLPELRRAAISLPRSRNVCIPFAGRPLLRDRLAAPRVAATADRFDLERKVVIAMVVFSRAAAAIRTVERARVCELAASAGAGDNALAQGAAAEIPGTKLASGTTGVADVAVPAYDGSALALTVDALAGHLGGRPALGMGAEVIGQPLNLVHARVRNLVGGELGQP